MGDVELTEAGKAARAVCAHYLKGSHVRRNTRACVLVLSGDAPHTMV